MEQLTYDPIRESQVLSRFRWLKPLRPPEPGTALVLVPYSGEPLTVRHGESIPDARHGTYRHMYLVDVAEHRLVLEVPLLSRDANFAFRSRVGLACRVAEPAEVVSRGIRDVSGALYDHMQRMLREVSRDYDIAEFHEAEEALNTSVRAFTGDSAIRLRNVHVELLVDEDEVVSSGRMFRDVKRETRLDAMRRERHLKMMREDGVEALLAEIVEREGPRAALEWIVSAESAERTELLSALETVLKHSDPHREPFDLVEAERAVVDRLVGGSAAPFGGTRSGRLRGSLAAGELSAGRTEETGRPTSESPVSGAHRRDAERSEPAKPPLRGEVVARPASAPPEDEPAGGGRSAGADDRDGGGKVDSRDAGGSERRASRVRGIPSSGPER